MNTAMEDVGEADDVEEENILLRNGQDNNNYPDDRERGEDPQHQVRRNSIREIMTDESLTPLEKRRNIQTLMDGRTLTSTASASVSSVPTTAGSISAWSQQECSSNASHPSTPNSNIVVVVDNEHNHQNNMDDNNIHDDDNDGVDDDDDDDENHSVATTLTRGSTTTITAAMSMLLGYEEAHGGAADDRNKIRAKSLSDWNDNPAGIIVHQQQHQENGSDAIWNHPLNIARRMERSRPICEHYERNCTIISPCCGLAFGCRICHDEYPMLPPPFIPTNDVHLKKKSNGADDDDDDDDDANVQGATKSSATSTVANLPPVRIHPGGDAREAMKRKIYMEKRQSMPLGRFEEDNQNHETTTNPTNSSNNPSEMITEVSPSSTPLDVQLQNPPKYQQHYQHQHHDIDRFAIAEIICRLCYHRQSSKTNVCVNPSCQAQFAAYHCSTCNLWMQNDEHPYHCTACGFCRVGGQENFQHCDDCGMCIDTLLFDQHNCKAGKYMSNCPVCQEDLFSSRDISHEMPCGHAIHWHCFKDLTTFDTRCPVCKKTAERHEDMAPTWNAMQMGIDLQPVPPELARVVVIRCNDCEVQQIDRRWHFLGVRCLHCQSFNTTVERTTMTGHDAARYLNHMDTMTTETPMHTDEDDDDMEDISRMDAN